MSAKAPVTYGRLARMRAQRQATVKADPPDSDTDPIDLIPSPTPSPSRPKKSSSRTATTTPHSRKLQDKMRTGDSVSSPSIPSSTQRRSAKTRSSKINTASSTIMKAPSLKRRRLDSGGTPNTKLAQSIEDPRSPKRSKVSSSGDREGTLTGWLTKNQYMSTQMRRP